MQTRPKIDYYTRPPNLPERIGAGGIVIRPHEGDLLIALIKEVEIGPNHYVLPKGGVEPGETLLQAAIREIHEEAGLSQLTHLQHLATTSRLDYGQKHWQINHYYLFTTQQTQGTILDTQNHHGFGWFPIQNLPPLFWPDEQTLIQTHQQTIRQALKTQP